MRWFSPLVDFVCVQYISHIHIHLDLIVCEFVGTASKVASAATAVAINNHKFVIVVVDNYKLILLLLCHSRSCW